MDDKKVAYLRRTFTFDTTEASDEFFFRAASGKEISKKSDTSFMVDRLGITLKSLHQAIVREGEPKELLIPLRLPQGKSKLILEYKW